MNSPKSNSKGSSTPSSPASPTKTSPTTTKKSPKATRRPKSAPSQGSAFTIGSSTTTASSFTTVSPNSKAKLERKERREKRRRERKKRKDAEVEDAADYVDGHIYCPLILNENFRWYLLITLQLLNIFVIVPLLAILLCTYQTKHYLEVENKILEDGPTLLLRIALWINIALAILGIFLQACIFYVLLYSKTNEDRITQLNMGTLLWTTYFTLGALFAIGVNLLFLLGIEATISGHYRTALATRIAAINSYSPVDIISRLQRKSGCCGSDAYTDWQNAPIIQEFYHPCSIRGASGKDYVNITPYVPYTCGGPGLGSQFGFSSFAPPGFFGDNRAREDEGDFKAFFKQNIYLSGCKGVFTDKLISPLQVCLTLWSILFGVQVLNTIALTYLARSIHFAYRWTGTTKATGLAWLNVPWYGADVHQIRMSRLVEILNDEYSWRVAVSWNKAADMATEGEGGNGKEKSVKLIGLPSIEASDIIVANGVIISKRGNGGMIAVDIVKSLRAIPKPTETLMCAVAGEVKREESRRQN